MTDMTEVTQRVRDRLALVKHLIEMNDPLAVPANAGPTKGKDGSHDGGWLHEYAQLDGLVNYLLFTCFDALGQRQDWVPFASWLAAEKYDAERTGALAMCQALDPVAIARHLHDHYNGLYGVRRAFMNFIDRVLVSEARLSLLRSIHLIQVDPAKKIKVVDSEKMKKECLFKLRNDFTHEARVRGGPRMSDGTRLAPARSDEPGRGAFPRNHLFTENGLLCMVHDWPFQLYGAVASVIGAKPPDFDVKYTVMLMLRSGEYVTLERVPREQLADPVRRAKLFSDVEEAARKHSERSAQAEHEAL